MKTPHLASRSAARLSTALFISISVLAGNLLAGDSHARNVILFLGDAGGIPTLNIASLYAHNKPQSLFIQSMPHVALMDTSAFDRWVTDSAAGMTAIVAGRKTNNGMLSVLPPEAGAEPEKLKTILEYAEEKGLATGVVTNMDVWNATPAACYAHCVSRDNAFEIFSQVLAPRFGDGVDVLVGAGRAGLFRTMEQGGTHVEAALKKAGYALFEEPAMITADVSRAVSIYDGGDFTPAPVVETIVRMLSRNPRGYFLMVEWDMHTDDVKRGLDRVIVMDEMIRQVAGSVSDDTLVIYAADHSFDLQLLGGTSETPMAKQIKAATRTPPPRWPVIRKTGSHTGEEVAVTAQGPGAERVRGFISNTQLFHIMMDAYGWAESP